jgi:hypothetical protein
MTTTAPEPTAQDWVIIRVLTDHHALSESTSGWGHLATTTTRCACGFVTEPSKWLGPQWEQVDLHLDSRLSVLHGAVIGQCWCGRLAVITQGTGAWYHADRRFQPHDAAPAAVATTAKGDTLR